MKQNVNMIRQMGDFEVLQRTKDSMFNATTLLTQWNKSAGMQKQMIHFLQNKDTEAFIESIMNEEDTKERDCVLLKSRGKGGGTWMHPLLFIDFAMWLNPKFKYHVLKFVHDNLIETRHNAGDNYRPLIGHALSIKGFLRAQDIAKMINWIVFNSAESNKRNRATQDELRDISLIEEKYCMLIEEGHIKDVTTLKYHLRNEWRKRHSKLDPKVFSNK